MGGKSSPPPPPQPDPYATARAQTGSNVSTSVANTVMGNANVIGPLGSTTYKQNGTYTLEEPVLDKDGNQKISRKWVAEPVNADTAQYRVWKDGVKGGETSMGGDTSVISAGTPGQFVDSRTGQAWVDGGRWVEEPEMLRRELPKWEQTNTLTPDQQRLLDEQEYIGTLLNGLAMDQAGRLKTTLDKPIDASTLPKGAADLLAEYGGSVPKASLNTNVGLDQLQTEFGRTSRGLDYGDGVSYANVGGPARSVGEFGFEMERKRVEDAIRARQTPELDRQRAGLENQLVNQGFVRGTQAFNAQMDEQIRRENDAELAAILGGGQEQSRMGELALSRFTAENSAQAQADEQARARGMFGLGLSQFRNDTQNAEFGQLAQRAGFANEAISGNNQFSLAKMAAENAARLQQQQSDISRLDAQSTIRQQNLQEQLALRNQPINEIAALMAGGQVTMPNFSQFRPAAMSETPVGDYVYKGYDIASQNYRAQEQANAQARAGLFSMGGQILGAGLGAFARSDIRVKTEITRVGRIENGLPVYTFRYKDGGPMQIGLMAQDVEKVRPEAVIDLGGLKIVDYAMAVQ
jgi:hypothetical protein